MSLMDSNKLQSSTKSWQLMALTFTCLEQLEFLAAIHSPSSSTKCNTEVASDSSTQSSKALRTLPINSMSWLTVVMELAEPAPSQKKNQERDSKLTTKSQWASIKSQEKFSGQSATKSSIRLNTTKLKIRTLIGSLTFDFATRATRWKFYLIMRKVKRLQKPSLRAEAGKKTGKRKSEFIEQVFNKWFWFV